MIDLCTGSGVVAIAAAGLGARKVTAFDICPHAIEYTTGNAEQAGVDVDARVGMWVDAFVAGPYDVVVSNPPYVPTGPDADLENIPVDVGPATAWDAGVDGRVVLDPLCDNAPELLAEGGTMLIVQSEFAGAEQSLTASAQRRLACRCRSQSTHSVRSGADRAGEVAGEHRHVAGWPPGRGNGGHPGGQTMTAQMRVVSGGPMLVQGPVRIEMPDGDRRRIRPVHGRDLHVPAQQDVSAVRHQPPASQPHRSASVERPA